jgi:hypothetical protein
LDPALFVNSVKPVFLDNETAENYNWRGLLQFVSLVLNDGMLIWHLAIHNELAPISVKPLLSA